MLNKMKSAFGGQKGLKKGFTLIELLVVIAIIAILATVVIMNVTGARAKAARAKVGADMSVATKVASACITFDGVLTAQPAGAAAYTGAICTIAVSAGVTDITEVNAATGNWPAIVGMTSVATTAIVPATPSVDFSQIITAPNGGVLTCTIVGCTAASSF